MLKLRKSRRAATEAVIVVDGERVEGYELPDDPRENARQKALMESDMRLRNHNDRTAFTRAMRNIAEARQETRGIVVFERVLFRGLFIDQRRWLSGERQFRAIVSLGRWIVTVKFTRGRP